MYKYPYRNLIISLILAHGNNRDAVNNVLSDYELPILNAFTLDMYYKRSKAYRPAHIGRLQELISYYKNKSFVPKKALISALRVVSSLQLRCIVESEILLGHRIEYAPELLNEEALKVYKFFFFDPQGWVHIDWTDYMKVLLPYEKDIIRLALSGKDHLLQIALGLDSNTPQDEIMNSFTSSAYEQYIKSMLAMPKTNLLEDKERWQEYTLNWLKAACLAYRTKMSGHAALNAGAQGQEKRTPNFRMTLMGKDGKYIVEPSREELELERNAQMLEEEARYKELADKAAAEGESNANNGTAKN